MSCNEKDFQNEMALGNNAAWEGDWITAVEHYTKAIQICPEDPDAHVNLGLALKNTDQLERSLKVYQRATQLDDDDPVPLEGMADVLERMGQLKEAAQQYVKVADIYLAQKDLDRAIGNWERATQLTPGLVSVHVRLAQAYDRIGDKKSAIREYLTLAFNFHRMNDNPKAIKAVDRALRLDKRHPQALNALRALRSGGDLTLPEDARTSASPRDAANGDGEFDLFAQPIITDPSIGESDPLGPMGEAMSEALVLLAEHVIQSGLDQYVAFALQGMEFHRQGDHADAVKAYQEAAKGGMNHPSLKLNLGALLVLQDQAQEAVKHLGEATIDPKLSAGALHALGQAYFKLNDNKKASRYLIQSLRAVDTSLAVDQTEIDDLTLVYESLLTALDGRTSEALYAINERFIGLLSGKDWKQRIAETRRQLSETLIDEGEQGLVELLVAKGGDELTESVSNIDRYIRQGLYTLAMDESHRAVEKSSFYLPIHVRMAEIMMKEGRIRQAINKYNTVAKAYLVRGENERAASILSEVLEMAPLDVEVRLNLIELLENEERMQEALDQYVNLAGTYEQLGDFDRASETYSAAERLAKRIDAPPETAVDIKHHIADIFQMRLNTRQAQKTYEQIIEISPSDEKALRALVEIYYTQGNMVDAVKRLDDLLKHYANKGMINKMVQMLEDLIRTYPQDMALRSRLASFYKRLNRTRDAIAQLDALGELQLEAGMNKEAAKTIKQIIGMGPDRVDEYKRLLSQLQ